MRHLSAKLVFFFLFFLGVRAPALDSQVCVRGFAKLTAGAMTFERGLQLGDPIQLKIGGVDGLIETVFIGKVQGAQGTETLLANLETGVRYHVPDGWISWKTTNQERALRPSSPHWFAQTEKNHDGTCMAHSAADCIIDISQTLKTLSNPNETSAVRAQREAIYDRFKPLLYNAKNEKNGFVQAEEFIEAMRREGYSVSPRSSTQSYAAEDVLQHLAASKPVLITFDAEYKEVVRAETKSGPGVIGSAGGNSVRIRVPAPARDAENVGAHAVLAVGVFDVPGSGKYVLIHDSSRQGLQVLKWSEVAESHGKNPIRYYIVDSKSAAPTSNGFIELARDLRAQKLSKIATELAQSPSNFTAVPRELLAEKLTSPELIGSNVILKRKAHGLSTRESTVAAGKIVSSVNNGDGKSKLIGFSAIGPDGKTSTVYFNSNRIDSLYVYRTPIMKSDALAEIIETTKTQFGKSDFTPPANPVRSWRQLAQSAKIGDSIALKYRPSLGSDDRYLSGTVLGIDPATGHITIKTSQVPHEMVAFNPNDLVSAAATSTINMRPLRFDIPSRFQKMASAKNSSNYALITLKTKDGAAVEVYGAISFTQVTDNAFRMAVTDSKGVVHTVDSGRIESMTAQFTPKSEQNRSLFYFEHAQPLNFLGN